MKADILRRAEEISDSESEEDDAGGGRDKGKAIAFEEELDEEGAIKVRDGDMSEEELEGTDGEEERGAQVSLCLDACAASRARTLTPSIVDSSESRDHPGIGVHSGFKAVR